jgi:hypothetical protein
MNNEQEAAPEPGAMDLADRTEVVDGHYDEEQIDDEKIVIRKRQIPTEKRRIDRWHPIAERGRTAGVNL